MEYLKVNDVRVSKNRIEVVYNISYNLGRFFKTDESFFVEYSEDISSTPIGVAIIPFVANILPLMWLTNSELIIPELDLNFYNSISQIKNGYTHLNKDASFMAPITVLKIIDYSSNCAKGCASFFSGGVDATSTLISVLDQKPILLTLWGSDIKFEDIKGRDNLLEMLKDVTSKHLLNSVFIKTSFRRFMNEELLDKTFFTLIHEKYFYSLQHGIGIISHAAPISYKYNLKTVYMPGSNSFYDPIEPIASHPMIDQNMKFLGTSVIYDGFIYTRQDKISEILKGKSKFKLRVCWLSSGGENCNFCEKCIRTICGILIADGDPNQYGFKYTTKDMVTLRKKILYDVEMPDNILLLWIELGRYSKESINRDIRWLQNFNYYSTRNRLKRAMFRFYRKVLFRVNRYFRKY